MWFRNKYLPEFAELFFRLNEADWLLEGRLHNDPQSKESYNELIEKEFINLSRLFTPLHFYDDLLYNLLDELENDFYKYPNDRYDYLRDVISYFVNIMPAIEKYLYKPYFINHLYHFREQYARNFKMYPTHYQESNLTRIWGKSAVELYVITCISVMDKFSTFLDAKCLNFNIDMEEIQRDLGIYLFRFRNYLSLSIMGYANKANLVGNIRPTFEEKHGFPVPFVTQNLAPIMQISTVQTQKSIDITKQPEKTTTPAIAAKIEKKIEENVFCKTMSFETPKEHFKVFKEKKNKNGDPFLTEEQFNAFINRAFYGKADIPKQKLNQSKGEKLLIQSVFYDFYNRYGFDSFNTLQCRDSFIHLLTDNFEGWDFKNVKDNFKQMKEKRH